MDCKIIIPIWSAYHQLTFRDASAYRIAPTKKVTAAEKHSYQLQRVELYVM